MIIEKNIVPKIAPKLGMAVTSEAALSDMGPDSNGDLSEVRINVFGDAQIDIDPYDAAKRLPKNITNWF